VRISLCCLLMTAAVGQARNLVLGTSPLNLGDRRATDGKVAFDGAPWNDSLAFELTRNFEFDFGTLQHISRVVIQADNNDAYVISASETGETYSEIYVAPPVSNPGLRTRQSEALSVNARFIRLSARGGDGRFSVSELEVFEGSESDSRLLVSAWAPKHLLDSQLAWAWITAVGFLAAASIKLPKVVLAVASGVTGFVLYQAIWEAFTSPEFDASRLAYLKAILSTLCAATLWREALFKKKWPAHPVAINVLLGFCAVVGLLCFPNLLRPQFFDVKKNQPTFLHHYDMRTYFPIAKYPAELRFDGVYAASALAVAEDSGGLESMAAVPFRDLRTHEDSNVAKQRSHIEAVRSRFSQEHWNEFKSDMHYFRDAMGDSGFLSSMSDHGGNATPVWLLGARLSFAHGPASDAALWTGVWCDVLLAFASFTALWWAFGFRTAAVGLTVFGAMDFYLFGTTWFGAALRHDWLSLWCLGVCFLKREKYALGGGALAWSSLIRAFPALAFVSLSIPLFWALRRARKDKTNIRLALTPFVRIALGAVLTSGVLCLLSVAYFGFEIWPEWLHKVALLDGSGHVNNIAVRTWILTERTNAWLASAVVVLALFWALRNASPATAAAWGVGLLPFVFNPANYYLHAVYILVVLVGEKTDTLKVPQRLVLTLLLLMCAASYFTTLTSELGAHFRMATILLVSVIALLLPLTAWLNADAAQPVQ
jgi:hypothetical protein